MVEPRSAEQAWEPGRTTAMVPCSWLEIRWGLCTGQTGQLLPSPPFSLRLWAGHPPSPHPEPRLHPVIPARHRSGPPAASLPPGAARQKGVLTMSGARVSGRLALGEILATGDVLYPVDFSVGGGAVGRADRKALRGWAAQPKPPPPRGLQAPLRPAFWSLVPQSSFSLGTRTWMVVLGLLVASQGLLRDGLPSARGGE